MHFVELTPFQAFRDAHWSDDEFRLLQNFLVAHPEAGNLIRGAHGLRKLRWVLPGKGKRGGARVIYYWRTQLDQIILIHAYAKSRQDDLSVEQTATLIHLLNEVLP